MNAPMLLRPWALLLLTIVLATLAGCGKRGSPVAPGPSSEITYPRIYPTH